MSNFPFFITVVTFSQVFKWRKRFHLDENGLHPVRNSVNERSKSHFSFGGQNGDQLLSPLPKRKQDCLHHVGFHLG